MTDEQTQASEELEQENAEEQDVQVEQLDDEQAEEETDELDADTAQAIEDITAKIADLDAQIEAHRTRNIDAMKQAKLKALGYTDEQAERYKTHIDGETNEEIKASVFALSLDVPPPADSFGDPSLMNGAKVKPATKDYADIGREAYKRVRNKIFPHLGGQ